MAAIDRTEGTLAAIRTALLANAELLALVGSTGIVTKPEAAKPLPYLAMQNVYSSDASTATEDAESVSVDIHIFAKANATVTVSGQPMAPAKRMMQIVKSVLHVQMLPISGFVQMRVGGSRGPLDDPDDNIHHMVVQVRVLVGYDA